jgi:uncharacterized protein (DUF2249 family)
MPVLAAVAVGGAVVSAFGSIQAGQAKKKQANQQALFEQRNAQQAELAMQDRLDILARETAFTTGRQTAQFAGAGVRQSGTVLDVLADSVNAGLRDKYRIEREGKFAIESHQFQAEQLRQAGKQAETASYIQAGSTLLTSFGNLGGASKSRSLAFANAGS